WVRGIGAAAAVVLASGIAQIAVAQKSGGVLRVYHRDSPASMSIHEEGTNSTEIPMMGVFNNLVVYDKHIAQNSLATIRPELADSWSWSEDGKALTFKLRPGVKWHDSKPFTAADVKCTWDLLSGRGQDRFRANPRKSWWNNVADIETNGDLEATFVLKRPQPALLTLIASGYTPVYPCHVPPAQMRQRPIGTGPFKFVEIKPNESIKVAKNPDYWKRGLPTEMLQTLPGYGPDVEKNRDAARKIMNSLGYGPDKHLTVKVAARNIPIFRDPAVILIDQLKPIWIDGELEPVDTATWFPK